MTTTLTPRALPPAATPPLDAAAAGDVEHPAAGDVDGRDRPGDERAWKCQRCGRTYCVCSRRRHSRRGRRTRR